MKYNSRRNRRHRNPHHNEGEKQDPFFSKTKADPSTSKGAFFQTKLPIGEPGDQYEQEADAMADHVVNNQNGQGKMSPNDPSIQQKEIPMISRMGGEEEEVATKPEIQKEGEEKEEVATKPELQAVKEEEVQAKPDVQKMGGEGEEEEMQAKPEINLSEETQEEMEGAAKQEPGARTASAQISHKVKDSQGKGKKLPASTQKEMSSAFGHDFSEVNIHTGEDSVAMNKELKAQAFTHKNDVFFNEGKYNPESSSGKHLLAHELTHVVQQNKSK